MTLLLASVSAPADSGRLRPGHAGSDSSWSWLLSSDYQLDVAAPHTGAQSVTLSVFLPPVSHTTWASNEATLFFCVCVCVATSVVGLLCTRNI